MQDNGVERDGDSYWSMWEPLAKHLDDISITFSCGNSVNVWLY